MTKFGSFSEDRGAQPPQRAERLTLKRAPSPGEIYWCSYPEDAFYPEFWKRRPIVVVSRGNTLTSAVTVLPITTEDQGGNKWAVNVGGAVVQRKNSWVVCDQPSSFSLARLGMTGRVTKKLPPEHFNTVLELMHKRLVSPRIAK